MGYPSRLRVAVASLAVLLLAPGCGPSTIPHRTPEWDLEAQLRIGSHDDPAQALTAVGELVLGANGAVYISQPQEQRIKVFSSSGELVLTIGRKGDGPGEFSSIGSMGWLGDTLYVSDPYSRRVSLFRPDGTYVRSISNNWPAIQDVYRVLGIDRLMDDGTVVVATQVPSQLIADGSVTALPLVRMDTAGSVLATVAEISVRNSQMAMPVGNGALYSPQPFGDAPLFGVSPVGDFVVVLDRRAATSHQDAIMRFIKITSGGDTVVTQGMLYDPVRFQTELIDSILDHRSAAVTGLFGSAREARAAFSERIFRPSFFPPASAIAVASEDMVFIRREALSSSEALWEVVTSEGTHLGSVSMPSSGRVFRANGNEVWATVRDEFDVTYVVRYRVTRP